jgi:hypothetical protein
MQHDRRLRHHEAGLFDQLLLERGLVEILAGDDHRQHALGAVAGLLDELALPAEQQVKPACDLPLPKHDRASLVAAHLGDLREALVHIRRHLGEDGQGAQACDDLRVNHGGRLPDSGVAPL